MERTMRGTDVIGFESAFTHFSQVIHVRSCSPQILRKKFFFRLVTEFFNACC